MKKNLLFLTILFLGQISAAQPIINSFSPASGPTGTLVTIAGNNFNSNPLNNIVFFGAVKGEVVNASSTSLSVLVPIGTTYEPITVTVNSLTAYSNKPFIVTTPNGSINQNTFTSGANFPITGSQLESITISDLDDDGKPDVIAANRIVSTVSVLKNTSTNLNISFSPQIDLVASNPYCVTTGDLNGDGKSEIAAANFSGSTIIVYANLSTPGNIVLSSGITYTLGFQPTSIAICDIDGDGRPDILVSDYGSSTISVLQNIGTNGQIDFSPRTDFQSGLQPYTIKAADLNGDSKPEIIVANYGSKSVSIWPNISSPGGILLGSRLDISNGIYSPISLSVGDVDFDDKIDIVTANNGTIVSVFKNTSTLGGISFNTPDIYSSGGSTANKIAISDIDGDLKPDIIVNNNASVNVAVLKNSSNAGMPHFEQAVSFSVGPVSGNTSNGFYVADINGDGALDITSGYGIYNSSARITVLKSSIVPLPLPSITSFFPLSASPGNVITITGNNFTGTTSVTFGGVDATSFTIVSPTTITAVVAGGSSGSIHVISPGGVAEAIGFTFISPVKYVTLTGGGTKNGNDWANAWSGQIFADTIYSVPPGYQVWISKGTYKPTKNANGIVPPLVQPNLSDASITFLISRGVKLYGGFEGNEMSIAERNTSLIHTQNKTILSGDLNQADFQGDNVSYVIDLNNAGLGEVLDGLTIQGAIATGVNVTFGPTFYLAPSINNCRILNNFPQGSVGGIYLNGNATLDAILNLTNCYLGFNHSQQNGALLTYKCKLNANNCIFYNNSVTFSFLGGASCINIFNTSTDITNCTFALNSIYPGNDNGPAIVLTSASDSVFINNSIFWKNYSQNEVKNLNVWEGANLSSVKNSMFQTQTQGTAPAVMINSFDSDPKFLNENNIAGSDNEYNTIDDGLALSIETSLADKGNSSFVTGILTDIWGSPRIYNNGVDIGAHELQVDTTSRATNICPGDNVGFSAHVVGSIYQWKIDTGSGYVNINNNGVYSGSTTDSLIITNPPTSLYGSKYKCTVTTPTGIINSEIYVLEFSTSWTGNINSSWENPGNWSCGVIPDMNTDVIISSGTVIVNSNTTIRTLTLNPGVNFTVNPGFNFIILH